MTQHVHSSNGHQTVTLPEAECRRWQPIRGGLLNIYRFDYEEFRFEKGRLLLRGNNGTGKSRILALLLPFLLDGEISPDRVEPDRDPAKRMEWNLLLNKYPDRLGYTWIEFGRKDESGETHYLTLGCGLYAVAGRGIASKWFFITPLRVGRDIFLAQANQPLSRGRLEQELNGRGEFFTVATDYRRAVDRALFGLGERYESLLKLLILLRQPKLSRSLDEKQISEALSEALPPLPSGVLNEVAEAFHTLDSDRRHLEDFTSARQSVQEFLGEYRRYVQIAARRRAEQVRKSHSAYEDTQRRLRKAETNLEEAKSALHAKDNVLAHLKEDESGAEQAYTTLASSPQMREADALADARRQVDERKEEVRGAEDAHNAIVQARQAREHEAAEASERESLSQRAYRAHLAACETTARSLGVATDHQAAVSAFTAVESISPKLIDRSKVSVERIITERREAIEHVRKLVVAVAQADNEKKVKQALFGAQEGQLEQAVAKQRKTHQELREATDAFLASFSDWASILTELHVSNVARVADDLAQWCEAGDGDAPLRGIVRKAADEAVAQLNRDRSAAESRLALSEERLTTLHEEIKQLEAGHVASPMPPPTRDLDARVRRAGAPFWKVCDFRPEIRDHARAGIEAALEASGLLDAWLTPNGQLLRPGEHDAVLVAGTSPKISAENSLARVLVPTVEAVVNASASMDAAIVTAVLLHIGVGPETGPIRVEENGNWQLGPLHGTWGKQAAEYIGREAQESRRQRRIVELTEAVREESDNRATIRAELDDLAIRKKIIEQETTTAPDPSPVSQLHFQLEQATLGVSEERGRLKEAEENNEQARRTLSEAVAKRDQDARDLRLSAWTDQLSKVDALLADYRANVAALWPTLDSTAEKWKQAQAAEIRASEARRDEAHRAETVRQLRERLAAAIAKSGTLEATKGAAATDVLAQLAAARERLTLIRGQINAANNDRMEVGERLGAAKNDVERLGEMLGQHQAQRTKDIESLNGFVATRLLGTAHPELKEVRAGEWTPTRAIEIARDIEGRLGSVESDDEAWKRNQEEIHQHIEALKTALLPHGQSPVARNSDGLLVVSVPFQGRDCSMDEFREALTAEIGQRQLLLNAREREVLENHLIGDIAAQLHDLLHVAEKWVGEVNRELHDRPMSTGMKLRFVWQTIDDGPAGLAEAKKRLMGASGTWSPADRAALGAFLQQRIHDVRETTPAGSWTEHLAEAFDYRKWHFFSVDRHQDGTWKRLTRKTYGTGSGGEKAIALTLPHFAAAAAYYTSAGKLAPRLILLDEAFVGVDKDMRKKCMGLLQAFDLDLVMTSETEWGCYPTVSALAIYQLATMEGIDAVGVHRWVWNGRERRRDEQTLPTASAPMAQELAERLKGNGNGDGHFTE
jgi:uncharacterized protein (TIGR02680 family)